MKKEKFKDFYNPTKKTKYVIWRSRHDRVDTYGTGHSNIRNIGVCLTFSTDIHEALIFVNRQEAILYYLDNERRWGFDVCVIKVDSEGNHLEKSNILETIMDPQYLYRGLILEGINDLVEKS